MEQNFFTQFRKNIITVLSLVMISVFGGCEKEPETDVEKTPLIEFDSKSVSVPVDGGEVIVKYKVLNYEDQDAELIVIHESNWISEEIDVSSPGEIHLIVKQNYIPEQRVAKVSVFYGKLEAEFEVVQGAKGQPSGKDFDLIIRSVESDRVHFSVVPKDKEMTYTVMIVDRMYYDEFKSDQEYFEALLDWYAQTAKDESMDLDTYFKEKVLTKGNTDMGMYLYETQTLRYITVFGVSEDKQITTPVFKECFAEGYEGHNDIKFDFSYKVNDGVDLSMSIIPDDVESRYFSKVVAKAELARTGMSNTEYMQASVDQYIVLGQILHKTAHQVISEIALKGPSENNSELECESADYLCLACSLTPYGIINSEVASVEFTTGKVSPSENQIGISLESVTSDAVSYSISTTNSDPYAVFMELTSNLKGKCDEEIIEYFKSQLMRNRLERGNSTGSYTELESGAEYSIFVFGYKGQSVTTGLFRKDFTTEKEMEKISFSIEVEMMYGFPNIHIVAAPQTALFFYEIVTEETTAEEALKIIDSLVEEKISSGWTKDRVSFFKNYGYEGEYWGSYMGRYERLEPGMYKVVVVGVDAKTGEYNSEVAFSEPFKAENF